MGITEAPSALRSMTTPRLGDLESSETNLHDMAFWSGLLRLFERDHILRSGVQKEVR